MSHIRLVLSYIVACALAFGYLASQYAYLYGDPGAYAAAVDVPVVKWLCLFIVLAGALLAFMPEKENE